MKESKNTFLSAAEAEVCAEAAEKSGGRYFLTDPVVPACKADHIEPPSLQTQEDTREFCGMHEV